MRIGIDLGGTKIEIAALDEQGRITLRRRIATPQQDSDALRYQATLQAIANLVQETESALGCTATVGIATPGAISPATGLLRNSNSVCLNGRPFRQDLQQVLAREIRMANDADCLALSEAVDGVASGAATVFGVILGTGVGGGIVVDRKLLCGPNAIAGEWGHNPLPWPEQDELPGPACYCGKRGCIETFLSGPGLERDHQRLAGQQLECMQIDAQAQRHVAAAEQTLARYERRLARALALVINILDPQVIVLGGGVSNIERLYTSLPVLLQDYVFSDCVYTEIVKAGYGDSSGVRGAAWLW